MRKRVLPSMCLIGAGISCVVGGMWITPAARIPSFPGGPAGEEVPVMFMTAAGYLLLVVGLGIYFKWGRT